MRGLWRDLSVSTWRVALSVLLGTAALGSAVALAAVAAWLIAKAAQMPSPADLAVAAVLVRTFGIGRGLFRYLERLASHDSALRGMAALRERVYLRLDKDAAARTLSLPRGEIVARLGADLDAIGDAVVRALIPIAVAITVSLAAVGIVATQHLGGALVLAGGLLLAAIVPALLTARATAIAERRGADADGEVTRAALSALEAAPEHRVWGTTAAAHARLATANRDVELVRDAAALPSAWAAALMQASSALTLVAAIAIGIAAAEAGSISGPAAAVVALTPLAAFEAVSAIPLAVTQAARSGAAAGRVRALWDDSQPTSGAPVTEAGTIELDGVVAGWPGATGTRPVSAKIPRAGALGIVGASGIGKTSLLLTLAGALPPRQGTITIGGEEVTAADTGVTVAMTAEDAHIFGATLIENLRAARGDLTEREAQQALELLGLAEWLSELPQGLATPLGSGGMSVSGGERRRLLLARALLHSAPIHLIDEPAEHLDRDGADAVRALVNALRERGTTVVIVTHDHSVLDVVDTVVDLDEEAP